MSAYRIKSWEELTIRDDYMFKLIMSRKRICKQMLERILHIEIVDLSYIETEKSMTVRYQSKGIRRMILSRTVDKLLTRKRTLKKSRQWSHKTVDVSPSEEVRRLRNRSGGCSNSS